MPNLRLAVDNPEPSAPHRAGDHGPKPCSWPVSLAIWVGAAGAAWALIAALIYVI